MYLIAKKEERHVVRHARHVIIR